MRIEDYVKENSEVITDLYIASALMEKRRPIIASSLMNLAARLEDLSESEDERIRKFLVKHVSEWIGCLEHDLKISPKDVESEEELAMFKAGLAYLEKQKEPTKEELPLMDGDTDTYFDDLRMTTTPLTSREWFDEGIKYAQRLQKEQKPAEWSKNDTVFLNEITDFFENKTVRLQHDLDMYAHWLKSLPERFNLQPKQEWSEEDEDMLNSCISSIEEAKENRYAYKETDGDTSYDHEIAWLKSLRPKPHWKPSEEDLMMLEHIIEQYEIGNKNSKVMGYFPRVKELDFLKKVFSIWKS